MHHRLLLAALSAPLFAACASATDDGPSPYDDEHEPSEDNINDGAPPNDSLPDDNKADAVYPAAFQLQHQSAVKSQGSRGVCSIFASTALIENLYLAAGMPAAEADFSEQYLQWAAKNLQRAFRTTEGSSADANLATAVRFGTVKEDAWRYESSPWTAANDAACTGGESLPTRCYTNGEPPAGVADATRYKLLSSRWINTNSMKAHLVAKGTGINVGMTFFYQAWNHRRSELPVDAELWRQGVVTYPNAEDKTRSLAKRAGHAIHIVGWDDAKEVALRDQHGNPILDAQGRPRTEQGFWLFKNSWGTTGFGVDHPYGAGYGWLSYKYVKEYGSAVVAELPAIAPARTYTASPNAAIPDHSTTGATSTITIPDTGTIADASLSVDIAHPYRGDLKLTLTRAGTSIVLFDRTGGSADNLVQTFPLASHAGASLQGAWTLEVEDTAAADTGTFRSWSLVIRTR